MTHIQQGSDLVRENCSLTDKEIVEEVGISKRLHHNILVEKLNMHRVSTKFIFPLVIKQDSNREICRKLLQQANHNNTFTNRVIMGDESWVCEYLMEKKFNNHSRFATTVSIQYESFDYFFRC